MALGVALAGFGSAHALTVLPDASASGQMTLQHQSFCGPACFIDPELQGFGSVTGAGNVAGASATATISATMAAFTLSTSFDVQPGWNASVTGSAGYAFEWVGPTSSSALIDTDIGVLVHTEVDSGATEARTTLTIRDLATNGLVFNDSLAGCAFNSCAHPDFNGTLNLSLMPNVVYELGMTTQLLGHVPFGGGATKAFIDPHIFQDPSSFNPLYSLALSSGVGNTVGPSSGPSGGPEPRAWALLVFGAGLAGWALRRRRRVAVA